MSTTIGEISSIQSSCHKHPVLYLSSGNVARTADHGSLDAGLDELAVETRETTQTLPIILRLWV